MNKGNTKYRKTYNLKATILSSLLLAIIIARLVYSLFNSDSKLEFVACLLMLIVIAFALIGAILGVIKGKIQISKENKYIKNTNPYIYYRELPNNFGIGVTSLLIDSTIENYKDIVAIILDLCARKYLNLIKQDDKYVIKILKDIDEELLSNEKYILTLLKNNDIKNINYQTWYNYCMQDGIDLGLYYHKEMQISNDSLLSPNKIVKSLKIHLLISVITGILIFVLSLFWGNIKNAFYCGLFCSILTFVILIVPFGLINIIAGFKNKTQEINYKNIIENTLPKTKKGIEELQKLYSFKAFINDFGHFVDKQVDEVVLWDRYLSYAQVFGLTKEIIKTGYRELIENSSFQIDNIDNINLYNIEIDYN